MKPQIPWFGADWAGWHAPVPLYADRVKAREIPCSLCGAPSGAGCVTRSGKRSPNHFYRAQVARDRGMIA